MSGGWLGKEFDRLASFQQDAYDAPWDKGWLPNWSQPGGFVGDYQKHIFNSVNAPGGMGPLGFVSDYYQDRDLGASKGEAYGNVGQNALTSAAILALIFGGSSLFGSGGEGGGGAAGGGGGSSAGAGTSNFGTYSGDNLVGDPVYNMSADGGTAGGINADGVGDVGGSGGNVGYDGSTSSGYDWSKLQKLGKLGSGASNQMDQSAQRANQGMGGGSPWAPFAQSNNAGMISNLLQLVQANPAWLYGGR